ncbi:PilW family protein [Microbulbifer sp. CAU 1566]|uniref:PilW family protein n=1 Tax=Microbulbifer sp. CAU 1566 TaxID=2933269 RepID=UPI002003E58D|nr:PilW family protein [Microbulbifer sp. CAU 1566]MCK7598783.1 PilW family protein [Microbulbifer sp. CAU 1566]
MKNLSKQSGISLVELMISITIGLILMTGVVQLFLSSRATFSTQQGLARVQETGRLAVEFLAEDIRMAGYMGCMSKKLNFTNTLNDSDTVAFDFEIGIEGLDNVGATVDDGYPDNIIQGTDVLVVRGANGNGIGVTRNNESGQLFAENSGVAATCDDKEASFSGLCENDILVVSDCQKARVFQATNLTATGGAVEINIVHSKDGSAEPGNNVASWGGNSSKDPDEKFGPDSQIIKMNTMVYYIANGTSGIPSLFRSVNGSAGQELLEGVQNLQITYGRDTNSDKVPDDYQTATEVGTAWEEVTSVRLELLVQSTEDNVLEDPQPYTFNGATENSPGDRRLRQVFINTVGIRSRLP